MFGTMDDDEDDPRCTCESSMFRSRCPLHGSDRHPEPPADVPGDCDHCGYERGTDDCCGRGDVLCRECGEARDRASNHANRSEESRAYAAEQRGYRIVAERERDEARGLARILAHAYKTDSRPPLRVVAEALAYPVRS